MDIVKHITEHTEKLRTELSKTTSEQKRNLKIATLGFYFQLPKFEETISKYINAAIDKNQLIFDITNENVNSYQKANDKSMAELDEYADDYEEAEPVEIIILDAFANAISDLKHFESLVGLFIGMIDTLDYYENFSDEPEHWNDLLEKEVVFQNEILSTLKTKEMIDASIYQKRYENVEFGEL